MNKLLTVGLFLVITQLGFSQVKNLHSAPVRNGNSKTTEASSDENQAYALDGLEFKPEFPGGISEFYKYIAKNFNAPTAKDFKGGKIMVSFVIERNGSVTSIMVFKDPGYGTAKETKRVLKDCPIWKPGVQNGKTVRVLYSLPITLQPN